MKSPRLPMIDATAVSDVGLGRDGDHAEACITCGDVAVVLTVVEVAGGDARCRADDGGEEVVAVDLVDPVVPGDRVLVHARVALERLDDHTSRTERRAAPSPPADDATRRPSGPRTEREG